MANRGDTSLSLVYDLGIKIVELGNLLLVGLVISQRFPGPERFSWPLAAIGFMVFALAYIVGWRVMKGGVR